MVFKKVVFVNIRDYIFNQLFFPKVVIIDRPGIIINQLAKRYGGVESRRRTIFHFEDLSVNLYLETVKKIGKEKTDDLWYKIGKDVGFGYLLFSKRKIPDFAIPSLLRYIFDSFNGGGMSFAQNVFYDPEKKSLIVEGENCVICRQTKSGYFSAGIVSGILSFFNKENIEAEPECKNCPKCRIIANKSISEKYIPNTEELVPIKDYEKLNFPVYNIKTELNSFSDFIKFKKISIDKKNNFSLFQNNIIFPSEVGLTKIGLKKYYQIGELGLFKRSIINSSQEIAERILENENDTSRKIKSINAMLSAFGWGIPYFKSEGERKTYRFLYPPITKYKPVYRAFILNGYLNYIYNKEFKMNKLTNTEMEFIC